MTKPESKESIRSNFIGCLHGDKKWDERIMYYWKKRGAELGPEELGSENQKISNGTLEKER